MVPTSTDVLAILVAVAIKQGLGFLWYSPMLFGGPFIETTPGTAEERRARMGRALTWDTAAAVVTAAALSVLADALKADSWFYGLLLGLACWLAFVIPTSAAPVLFEGRSARLFGLRVGCLAISYAVMGAVVGGWR